MRLTVVILCLLACMAGCRDKKSAPSGILKFDTMQAVLWDVIQAEALTAQIIKKDSLLNAPLENLQLQQQIFSEHQITKEEFYKSYQYYSGHFQLMRSMIDSITTSAERNKYSKLYNKPVLPAKMSLMPLPALPTPVFIPMPIPGVNTVQVVTPDTTNIRKRMFKPGMTKNEP